MIKNLINLLKNNFKKEVFRQGSLSDKIAYPSSFFTYWNTSSEYSEYFDNKGKEIEHTIQLCYYSKNIEDVYEILRNARNLLVANGYFCNDVGSDIPSQDTDAYGRAIELTFVERKEE